MSKKPLKDKEFTPPEGEGDEIVVGPPEDDELEIEVVDDTPEADRNKKPPEEDISDDDGGEDEDEDDLSKYSERVQKRIKKMSWERHEERRAREAAARERDEAIAFARRAHEEAEMLRKHLSSGETALIEQSKARFGAELGQARAALRAAYEEGDADKIADAQEKMTRLTAQMMNIENYRPVFRDMPQRQQPPQQQQPQQPPQPEKEALDWVGRNPWFNTNTRLRAAALQVHQELVQSGVQANSAEYYRGLDEAMEPMVKSVLGSSGKLRQESGARPPATVVASAPKSGKRPRSIQLTASQVRVAEKLGVPLRVYAEQMLKDQQKGE